MSIYVLLASSDNEFNDELLAEANKRINKCSSAATPHITWVLPSNPDAYKADMAACWYPDSDLLEKFPNIKSLHSLAAGVDHLGEPLLGSTLPVCRIVDEEQKVGMLEYALWGVLYFQRDFDRAIENQKQLHWQRYPQRTASSVSVGVMGLGEIGSYVAQGLAKQGYKVSGWSNSKKNIPNVQSFAGQNELKPFLKNTEILINLLPLNESTFRIIDNNFIKNVKNGSALVNCGRGGHIDYDALTHALNFGKLRGAILDVFDEEPLSEESALWRAPNLLVTPHMASASSTEVLVEQVSNNAKRLHEGLPLKNCLSFT